MIYLDNAATSHPKPEAVYKRVSEILRTIGGNPGRGGHRMALEATRVVFSARETIAKLFNIKDSSRIVFTKNATEACNIALKGLLRPNDHVITTHFEHNSIARTLGRLEKDGVIKVTKVKGRRADMVESGDIEKAITKNTKLAVVAHASNVFGTIEPIKEIGEVLREKGIHFMVDGAQTTGAIPMDVEKMEIDILATTGHKALFGPQGTGFLYLREGVEPVALIDGGSGEMDVSLDMPDRLETGTMNTSGIGGLGSAVEFLLKEGISKIRKHEESLMGQLIRGLEKIRGIKIIGALNSRERVSLISFNMDGKSPEEVGSLLDSKFSIMTRCGVHCAPDAHKAAGTYPFGSVRVSPGYFNTDKDIEEFLKAVFNISKG